MKYKPWSISPKYLQDLEEEEFISVWILCLASDLG